MARGRGYLWILTPARAGVQSQDDLLKA